MTTKIEDETSICDNCGREFPFSTGTIVYDKNHEPIFLCPDCYKEWTEKPGGELSS